MITKNISVNINNIGNSIKATLEKAIALQTEGKCIVEGYVKPNTVEIITFSSGLITGAYVIFEVVFQCYVCSPVEGMLINCVAKHINKAGIKAEVNESPSPVVIFIARDHNYASPLFSQVKENDDITVRVIGQRFELNDKYISIIAELVEAQQQKIVKPMNRTIKKSFKIVAEGSAAEAAAEGSAAEAAANIGEEIQEDLNKTENVVSTQAKPTGVESNAPSVKKKTKTLRIKKPASSVKKA
jgi:DNA-directed RNA polymerase subunit E'/Rpb7